MKNLTCVNTQSLLFCSHTEFLDEWKSAAKPGQSVFRLCLLSREDLVPTKSTNIMLPLANASIGEWDNLTHNSCWVTVANSPLKIDGKLLGLQANPVKIWAPWEFCGHNKVTSEFDPSHRAADNPDYSDWLCEQRWSCCMWNVVSQPRGWFQRGPVCKFMGWNLLFCLSATI